MIMNTLRIIINKTIIINMILIMINIYSKNHLLKENVLLLQMDTMNGKITVIKKNHILFNSVMES